MLKIRCCCFRSVLVAACLFTVFVTPRGLFAQQVQLVAETEPLTPEEQRLKFHLPPGFVIELVAAEPDIRKPMNLKFDAAGRLYVTQSIEYPFPVGTDEVGRDTIRVLVDSNGDGVPDTTHVYAEGLNIPIGITPVPGGVLAYSIPELSYFPAAPGELRAEGRRPLYASWGFRDTHGMCSSLNYWIDGWVYGCHGFSNESTVQGSDEKPLRMQSGNTYRLRPDGTRIEAYTRGQVNPFGMCFDPWGNVYTSDCHTRPAYMLLRGAYYPSFGKPHDGLGFGPEIMQHAHGSTGLAGIVYYEADRFPEEYQGNLLIGNPVTGRVNRDTLAWTGSTPKAIEQPDFLWCDDPWFRPVDLQLAPDGSLYIADFYNRIIGHYEVPLQHPGRDRERGRIWRVRYVGTDSTPARGTPVPALNTASARELIAALDHPNLWVRVQATHQLVDRIERETALAEIDRLWQTPQATPRQRAHSLWVWARLGKEERVVPALQHSDPLVRTYALQVAGDVSPHVFPTFAVGVQQGMRDADARVKLAAVQAAAKHPQPGWERELLAIWNATDPADAMLIHAIRITLRDHLAKYHSYDPTDEQPREADQTQHIADVALGVPDERAAEFLDRQLTEQPPAWFLARLEEFVRHIIRHLPQDRLQARMEFLAQRGNWAMGQQLASLRAADRARQERGIPRPDVLTAWADRLARASWEARHSGTALELIRDFGLRGHVESAREVADSTSAETNLRKLAFETLVAIDVEQAVSCGADWLSSPTTSSELQEHAAGMLGRTNRADARELLLAKLQAAPEATARSIARGLAMTPTGGSALMEALEQGRASPRLLQDGPIEQRLAAARLPEFQARREKLLQGFPAADERILKLISERRSRFSAAPLDLAAGQALFKQHCANCHRLGNEGAKVGPELEGVGLRGLDRLLEDTLDPSRVIDQAFRTTVINTVTGKVITGLVLREEGAVVVLADEQGREIRVDNSDIEERSTIKLSPMPANIAEKLSETEFFHLMGYLLEQRTKSSAGE